MKTKFLRFLAGVPAFMLHTSGVYPNSDFLEMILGLTGSFGSGKSTVAQMMSAFCDARIIDADLITRELQMPGAIGHARIIKAFGPSVMTESGELDRRKLADIVFNDEESLERLNSIIHPLVMDEEMRMLDMYANDPLVVLMVPLLYESGTEKLCDKIAVVTVTEEERNSRLAVRDNLTPELIMQRLAAQMPQAEKAKRADFVIDNSGSTEATEAQVLAMLKQLGISTNRHS